MKNLPLLAVIAVFVATLASCYPTPQDAVKEYVDKYGVPDEVIEEIADDVHKYTVVWSKDGEQETVFTKVTVTSAVGEDMWSVAEVDERMSRSVSVPSFMDGMKR